MDKSTVVLVEHFSSISTDSLLWAQAPTLHRGVRWELPSRWLYISGVQQICLDDAYTPFFSRSFRNFTLAFELQGWHACPVFLSPIAGTEIDALWSRE